jgi:hypothetical protein
MLVMEEERVRQIEANQLESVHHVRIPLFERERCSQ